MERSAGFDALDLMDIDDGSPVNEIEDHAETGNVDGSEHVPRNLSEIQVDSPSKPSELLENILPQDLDAHAVDEITMHGKRRENHPVMSGEH